MNSLLYDSLQEYARALKDKFSVHVKGESEEQIRGPIETLLRNGGRAIGHDLHAIGNTHVQNTGIPDFGVSTDGLLCGHLEVKAPGKGADPAYYKGHDRQQWEKFKDLPNLIYTDGINWSLYRHGICCANAQLVHDPRTAGDAAVSDDVAGQLERVLRDFINWEPIVPGSAKQLASHLAPLCRMLRDDVYSALKRRAPGVVSAASDWRRYLFPDADDSQFADSYAQTVTFALLLARSDGSDTLFIDKAVASLLDHNNALLSRALKVLTDPLVHEHLNTSLGLLQRVIAAVPTGTMSGGRRDPWLHFYEDFLAEYDPILRKDAGAYYTPVEVVQAQVRLVDSILRERMGKKFGLASNSVNILDPALGTGTYLLGVVEHALKYIEREEGAGAVTHRAELLASNMYGFEIMVGPYSVAALRLTRLLYDYGADLPADGVQVMLNNTLESPQETIPELPLLYKPIGIEHQRARRVKEAVPILVCMGNPPYDRHAAADDTNRATTGGWVRWGEKKDGTDAILQDFIVPVRKAKKGGDLKNLYNLYVYFWRWALWKTFEHELASGPGIVTYISASSFLDGDAFLGMRQHMRTVCDEIWIVDLGGEGRGSRQDENVFAIKTPVAITVAVRYKAGDVTQPAVVHYSRTPHSKRSKKLAALEALNDMNDLQFSECPSEWTAPFLPIDTSEFFSWPKLTDLMPWCTSGCQIKRNWPIGTTADVLKRRWSTLARATDKASLFKETRDRKVTSRVHDLSRYRKLIPIAEVTDGIPPTIERYAFRSFDRQYLLVDNRLADYLRPSLWLSHSDYQVYLTSLLSSPLGAGPGITASTLVPDMHHFSGRGARDVLPLYRDSNREFPNIHPELRERLSREYGKVVSPEEWCAYVYAIVGSSAYTERFHGELRKKEVRIPVTKLRDVFEKVVDIGKYLLFLHTYGERFADEFSWPDNIAKCITPVTANGLPENYQYNEETRIVSVNGGAIRSNFAVGVGIRCIWTKGSTVLAGISA